MGGLGQGVLAGWRDRAKKKKKRIHGHEQQCGGDGEGDRVWVEV